MLCFIFLHWKTTILNNEAMNRTNIKNATICLSNILT
jgi:hypothetical protein